MNRKIAKFLSFFIIGSKNRKEFRQKMAVNYDRIDVMQSNINFLTDKVRNIENFINKKYSKENYIYPEVIHGELFYFSDSILSTTADYVAKELNEDNEYDFENIDFKEGDCVIDIGGNIGMVSIYLAKKFPFLKIYAFEPVRENYENFLKNIKLNNIPDGTIIVENKAVTSDGRNICMNVGITNKGGSSMYDMGEKNELYIREYENSNVPSITLNDIFKKYNINNLKLLKIDCEGAEFEILYNTDPNILKNIEILKGEFHDGKLEMEHDSRYNSKDLLNFLQPYIKDIKVYVFYGKE